MSSVHEPWPALLTRSQAARYLNVGESTIKSLRAAGEISSVLVREKIVRYRRSDLDKFIDELPEGSGDFESSKARARA